MKWILANLALALTLGACTMALGQGGQGGGMGGGSFRGGGQGQGMRQMDNEMQDIQRKIETYLNGQELKSVLTPGEYCEWTIKLKPGQVVVAEARSDAFDPALEIVDDKGKVMGSNDDRYPGDQRPLLFWRCEREGTYALHVRCFHDKSGGQFFVRFRTYESVDLPDGQKIEKDLKGGTPFMLRIPMRAGQIDELISQSGTDHNYIGFRADQVIAPGGLPNTNLSGPISPVSSNTTFMAPVAGAYYVMATPFGIGNRMGKIHAWTHEIVPSKLAREGSVTVAKAPTNVPALWELSAKAGEFLEASTADLNLSCQFVLAEEPDISKFDVTKPESNPFFPQANRQPSEEQPAFDVLPARARDGRMTVFSVRRNVKLWLASNGAGPRRKEFTLRVKPAASAYAPDTTLTGKLRIGNYDYWAFDAKAGDVMSLIGTAGGFAEEIVVRDPDLNEIRHDATLPDQTSDKWKMVVQKPGRYLVSVSCIGDGGGGDYTLSRQVFHAREFGKSNPAKAEISDGEIQIWEFKASPEDPLLIHWMSSNWSYEAAIYNEKGDAENFQREFVDSHNTFGILKVQKTQTYVIVLTGHGPNTSYAIDVTSIPGYKQAPNAK